MADRIGGRAAALAWAVAAARFALAACGPARQRAADGLHRRRIPPRRGAVRGHAAAARGEARRRRSTPARRCSRSSARTRPRRGARPTNGSPAPKRGYANLQTGKRPPEVETVAEQLQQARAARDLSAANFKRQQKLFTEQASSARGARRRAGAAEARRGACRRARSHGADDEAAGARRRDPRGGSRRQARRAKCSRKATGDSRSAPSPRRLGARA